MEFIKYAAVEYTDPKTNITKIWGGYDHNKVYDDVAFSQSLYLRCKPECCREGYLTSDGVFKDRQEALIIAKNADQLKDFFKNATIYDLYSYMLKEDYQKCT